jgi:hypothetical protein
MIEIDRSPEWEIEIAFFTHERGMPALDARTFTICRWMFLGDLRPLAAALDDGPLDAPVISLLVRLIHEGRLRVVPNKPGAPRRPARFGRDTAAALAYERHTGKSEDAIDEIADAMRMSKKAVSAAITSWNAWKARRPRTSK